MDNLQHELNRFQGTDICYRHSMMRTFAYTDGIDYLAEKASAYWLIDEIAFFWLKHKAVFVKHRMFRLDFRVNKNKSALLTIKISNNIEIGQLIIPWTDFPLESITLFLEQGDNPELQAMLLLYSEERRLLENELQQFSGTENYYWHPLGLLTHTDGVEFLVQKTGATQLVDHIAGFLERHKAIYFKEGFFSITLRTVNNKSALLLIDNGNGRLIGKLKMSFDYFPLKKIKLFLVRASKLSDEAVLMLPTEY